MKSIRQKIEEKLNAEGIIKKIVDDLPNTELNSLYLELFKEQSSKINPSDLVKQYSENRFTKPSPLNIIDYKKYEIKWLEKSAWHGFEPVLLSPLTPLGTCSVAGLVDQNNIVSAVRGTEVVSDATNVLALLMADKFKTDKTKQVIRYSTTHRHTRAQYFTNPAFSAHFGAFCMVSGGYDTGSFLFEINELRDHLKFYLELLSAEFDNNVIVKIYFKTDREDFKQNLIAAVKDITQPFKIITDAQDHIKDYYETVRIKIFINYKEQEIDLVDMGFVNWTQTLLNNKKHRMLISGGGLELIYKIKTGLI